MAKSVYARYGESALTGSTETARRWTVLGGQTIQSIAAEVYPDQGYSSEAWRQLAEFNDIEDLDDIDVGTVLTVPQFEPVD